MFLHDFLFIFITPFKDISFCYECKSDFYKVKDLIFYFEHHWVKSISNMQFSIIQSYSFTGIRYLYLIFLFFFLAQISLGGPYDESLEVCVKLFYQEVSQ